VRGTSMTSAHALAYYIHSTSVQYTLFKGCQQFFYEGDMPARRKGASTRAMTHDDVMQASANVDPELRRRSELLWADRSPGTRGPKRAVTPEDVVQMAVQIADEEGLAALTMHAVSSRLGFTTMAIYRYLPNKEALYDAIVDAGLGLPPRPLDPSGDWRDEVAHWARAMRAMLCARPWLAELPFVAAPHGPNWLSWLEALARPLALTGLPATDVGQMISVVEGYTRGASDTSISLARARRRGISEQEWVAAVGADLGRAIGDPRFPTFAALITAPSSGHSRTQDESFDFGLERVLDGIEHYVKAQQSSAPARVRLRSSARRSR
jgi:AcrR family transcriptional regulator